MQVCRPRAAADLGEAVQITFQRDDGNEVIAEEKSNFWEFYIRLIPNGPMGPNPNPVWGDLFPVFTGVELACINATVDEEELALARESAVFEAAEVRQSHAAILDCLAEENAGHLAFAIAFAQVVIKMQAAGGDDTEIRACVAELRRPAVEALSAV